MELDAETYQLTKNLSLHFLQLAVEGDTLLARLPSNKREEVKEMDPWRRFSPYTGQHICLDDVWVYVVKLMTSLDVSEECCILTTIFIDRFIDRTHNVVCSQNIFPLITAAYILACKVHEDACQELLLDVHDCLPFMSVPLLKRAERLFLISVDYNLFVGIDRFRDYIDLINGIQ
eukprot:TRINITY_DN12044_c0_g1_i1.p1 TRINITY_DN12044_c0_g1~~TRINITY_DN12044_c0_g1_i1.p1  ORF type:complete len:175 (-),score=18.59 TRINITY_DN12044_c0_g1_i1:52-576(-)